MELFGARSGECPPGAPLLQFGAVARTHLSYLRVQELTIQDIWAASPESFYAETAAEIDTFAGVAAATMYRDDGWRFMQLGRSIERAQLVVTLLLAQLASESLAEEHSDADWTSLLRAYHAFEVYTAAIV